MNILPKFLFLFQCIPILINNTFFTKLDSLISNFIWNKKTPRIKKYFLQRPKYQGGMGLPCFRRYYWSCNIRSLSFWLSPRGADWVRMESDSNTFPSLEALIYLTLPEHQLKLKNPVVSHSVKIWSQIRKHYGWKNASVQIPLINNYTFTPSFSDKSLHQWTLKGIHSIKDLFIDNLFPTFQQLQEKFHIENRDFFKYLQIRSFVKSMFPSFTSQPPDSMMDTVLLSDPLKKGAITKIHNMLSELDCTTTLDHLKRAWQEDLRVNITENQWTKAQEYVHSSSVCVRHGLLQFKILHRLHLSKLKLSKMFSSVDPSCDRCKQGPASLAHMFWNCPHIITYWDKVFINLSKILKKTLKPDPILALFGVNPVTVELSNNQKNMTRFILLLARRLILLNWKSTVAPSLSVLMKEVMKHLQLEKIKFLLRGKLDTFDLTWQPFINHFNAANG